MSFGLSRGRRLDATGVAVTEEELGPLPDEIITNPEAGRIDPREWFEEPGRPLEVEIGSGKGTFLVQEGRARPETNFLGMEYAGEFFGYAADRVRRSGLTNVRMLRGDAGEFMKWRMPAGIVRVIHLYFPDPWPKARHHRRRMISDAFLVEARRVLEPGGELRVVTDHEDYWRWMEEHWARWAPGAPGAGAGGAMAGSAGDPLVPGGFVREPFDRPGSAGEDEVVGTNFERKYRREGRPFYAVVLVKRVPGSGSRVPGEAGPGTL